MEISVEHLGLYSDLVAEAKIQGALHPLASPGKETHEMVKKVFRWNKIPKNPIDVPVEKTWGRDGLEGEQITALPPL